jgi:hypothetical protein
MGFESRRRRKPNAKHWESVYRISPTEEVTAHEVAEKIDCTVNTARSRLRNPRMTIEDLYKPVSYDKNQREGRTIYSNKSDNKFRRQVDDPMYRLAFSW